MRYCFLTCLIMIGSLSAKAERTVVETFASSELKHMIVCPTSSPKTPQTFTGVKGVKWQYWLGGGNHACFGAQDSCMYIRARKSNETCDYGYLQNIVPISGGLKALSFNWKQGGDETEISNYDIAILVNDSLVGEITQEAQATYTTPADSTPYYYELNDLNIEGDFTLKIENRTAYNGTSNRGRFVFNDLTLTIIEDEPEYPQVHGYVLDQDKNPIVGAAMSDGYTIVQTDSKGYYEIQLNQYSDFVFISVPSGYDIPVDPDGAPLLYAALNQLGDQRVDFTLNHQADGGKADSTHVMLAISDPQVLDNYCLWRYRQESIKDMQALMATYPAGTKFYASVVGDIVWDWYNAFDAQRTTMASLGVPCFMTIGNHDHNCNADCVADQEREATKKYTAVFGPTYYSYNIGAIHYISIDNILYTGCKGSKNYEYKIPDYQLNWLKQDAALVPEGTPIVVFCHAPVNNAVYLDTLKSILNKGEVMQYIISGHSHNPHMYSYSDRLHEHNLGAVMGAYWCSDWCSDGTPNGYEVLQAGANGYTDYYYKSTGYDRDYQFRAYAPGNIDSGDGKADCVRANVWMYEKDWKVYAYENGIRRTMLLYSGIDPIAYDVMRAESDARPNYPGSDGGTIASKNPGASYGATHIFYIKPLDANAEFEIEVVDKWGNTYRQPVISKMMVAGFEDQDTAWVYTQDFNSLFSYPNHFSESCAKGTFVQGHYPLGWYASGSGNGILYNTFNYYRIGNGSHADAGLYNYGEGDITVATKNKKERSLGLQPGASNKSIAAGLIIENNTQQTITALDIEYTGEVWRVGSSTEAHTMTFEYLANPDIEALRNRTKWLGKIAMEAYSELDFKTPTTLQVSSTNVAVDGNNSNNRASVRATLPVLLQPKESVLLRWTNSYNFGKEQGFGIDDVRIKAITSASRLYEADAAVKLVKKIYRDGQILIVKDEKVYNLLGEACTIE